MTEEVPLDILPREYKGDLRLLFRDALVVLRRPDFGPVLLPDSPEATAARPDPKHREQNPTIDSPPLTLPHAAE